MVFILEGAPCVGKTTLLKNLKTKEGFFYLFEPEEEWKKLFKTKDAINENYALFEAFVFFSKLKLLLENMGKDILLERSFFADFFIFCVVSKKKKQISAFSFFILKKIYSFCTFFFRKLKKKFFFCYLPFKKNKEIYLRRERLELDGGTFYLWWKRYSVVFKKYPKVNLFLENERSKLLSKIFK